MKKFIIRFEQNRSEYTGSVFITAKKCKKQSERIVIADSVQIEFNENIISVEKILN